MAPVCRGCASAPVPHESVAALASRVALSKQVVIDYRPSTVALEAQSVAAAYATSRTSRLQSASEGRVGACRFPRPLAGASLKRVGRAAAVQLARVFSPAIGRGLIEATRCCSPFRSPSRFPRPLAGASLKQLGEHGSLFEELGFPRPLAGASLKRRARHGDRLRRGRFSPAIGRGLIEASITALALTGAVVVFPGHWPGPH